MPPYQIRSTRCSVTLVTPENIRLVFDAPDAESDLLQVSTHNDLGEACGSFTLTFAPVRIQGRTYDQLIPLRSLVTIAMEGLDEPTRAEDRVVMVGLTDDHSISEDYSRGQPQRVVTISGRSMACVFLDMQLRHYPGLEDQVEGTLRVGDQYFNLFIPTDFLEPNLDPREALRAILTYFLGVKSHIPLQRRESYLQRQQALRQQAARQPDQSPQALAQTVTVPAPPPPRTPVGQAVVLPHTVALTIADAITAWMEVHPGATQAEQQAESARLLAEARAQTGAKVVTPPPRVMALQAPARASAPHASGIHNVLLNLQLPGVTLADLLDINDHTWTLFDEGIRISIGQNTPYASSLWHYIGQFVDRAFQEFFTRVEGGVVKVIFRAKPFSDTTAFTGTRFSETDPTCQTIQFSRAEWEARYLGSQLKRQVANVYNAFLTLPLGAAVMWRNTGIEKILLPVFLSDPEHPSYLAKYGLRELHNDSPYLSTKRLGDPSPTEAEMGDIKRIALEWEKKAAAWYGLGSEMYNGVMSVVGSARYNVGHRLLIEDERGPREFYLEGVGHSYDMRTGRYLSQLRVSRGWYLSGLVDERGPQPGWKLHLELNGTKEAPGAR